PSHSGQLGQDRQGASGPCPGTRRSVEGRAGQDPPGRGGSLAEDGPGGAGEGRPVPRASRAVRGPGCEGTCRGRRAPRETGRGTGGAVARMAAHSRRSGGQPLVEKQSGGEQSTPHRFLPLCCFCCSTVDGLQERDQATCIQWTASTSIATVATTRPIPGPVPDAPPRLDDCCDHTARMPSTKANHPPTAHTHVNHHLRVANASAEANTPKPVDVAANSCGIGPASPSNASQPA